MVPAGSQNEGEGKSEGNRKRICRGYESQFEVYLDVIE